MLADISLISPMVDRLTREEAKRRRLEKERAQRVPPARQNSGSEERQEGHRPAKGRALNAYA